MEIDKVKWNNCIRHSVNGIIYAYSWYLDIVCPQWDGLVEGDYETVFPLTNNRKFGIQYLFQPYFTQQLGVFSGKHLTGEVVEQFLQHIPSKFRFTEINLNAFNRIDPERYPCTTRLNYVLDLINSYENLYRNYDQNTKRNIRKALSGGVVIQRKMEPDELITLFRENYGNKEGKLKFHHYDVVRKLMIYALKNTFSMTLGAYLPGNVLCAGAFFLKDRNRVIFHFAASDPAARESGAMFLLIDSFIREHAGQALTLDFEGSSDPNVARLYRGFGASECNYQHVRIDRLPWILKKGVYFIRKIR